MKKIILPLTMALVFWANCEVLASPLVTSDVPLDSKYYRYIEKLEGMGFIVDMPANTKPYSRLMVAKMLAKVNPEGMQPYLRIMYDEMVDNFSDEIAYTIVHNPLVNKEIVGQSKKKAAKFHQEYYAHRYNYLVQEKIKLAQPKHFPSNVKFRNVNLEFSGQSFDKKDYRYRKTDASYQPLHGQNYGYRYGKGFNAVGSFNISGSLNNDLALSITPRFSYDKDDKSKVSLQEGYLKTHLGIFSLQAGKEALNWGAPSREAGFSLSGNAPSLTTVKLGLLEPMEIEEGFFKFLGKVDFNMFWAKLENNRTKRFRMLNPKSKRNGEFDSGNLVGMRLEFTPKDTFAIGFERIGMVSKFGKNWFFTTNDGVTEDRRDFGNDQAGMDWRWKFPGVEIYGAVYGEDGTFDIGTGFISNKALWFGAYFPQLAKDGSWDLRIEHKKNSRAWYTHGGCFENGWSYHQDILGDPMGNRSSKQTVEVNNYLRRGDVLSFRFMNMTWDRLQDIYPKMQEYQVGYSRKINDAMHLDSSVGYATINNADSEKGRKDKSKYVAVGLRWEF